MPMINLFAEAFGMLIISLVVLFAIVCLLCIFRVAFFTLWIHRNDVQKLKYFNGPWVTRIFLIVISVLWNLAEIVRLSFLNLIVFYNTTWKRNICMLYLCSLGFSEPCIFVTIVFLLHSSLQKREIGALSRWWNIRTIALAVLVCLPVLAMQIIIVFSGSKVLGDDMNNRETKFAKYFTRTSSAIEDNTICTYPLLSTIVLGFLYILVICYALCIGMQLLSSVINKHLCKRLNILLSSLVVCVSTRVLLLGFSVLLQPGNLAYELIVFLAFLSMLICIVISIVVLVYFPVTDSMALRDLELQVMPFDDCYHDDISLVGRDRHEGVS